jgi:hypothetical protein
MDHALASVVRVFTLRKALDDRAQRVEGLACGRGRTLGEVNAEQTFERVGRALEIDQPLDVPRVVDPGMRGVLADERIGRIDRRFALA